MTRLKAVRAAREMMDIMLMICRDAGRNRCGCVKILCYVGVKMRDRHRRQGGWGEHIEEEALWSAVGWCPMESDVTPAGRRARGMVV